MNVKPKLDCPHSPLPLARAMGRASPMLMPGKFADRGQSCSFGFSHGLRRVGSRLLGRQTFQQSPRFLIGTDRGHFQNRSAVTGFDEALLIAR